MKRMLTHQYKFCLNLVSHRILNCYKISRGLGRGIHCSFDVGIKTKLYQVDVCGFISCVYTVKI